jgi:multiple sugar transport system ATP-binding protein
MASLSLKQLSKAFGANRVVNGIDLEVADGEFVVLVGPSGCGKSTLLRLVAGLETADAGTISLDDRRVDHRAPGDRDIAMVFQNYALYPHMTVAANIGFPLRMARMAREERSQRVREAAAQLGIEDLLDRKPGSLSGGQQQRVALARALVRRPRIFLFDEPLSNVDAKLRNEMRAELARLHAKLGATILHVTHDQVEAMTLGTRIVVLDRGVIQQQGSPLEVYERPANTFVAGFLGSPPMNLLRQEAGTIGFRPHAAHPDSPHKLEVDLVEPLGQETLLHGTLIADDLLPSGKVVIAVPPAVQVARGDQFCFGLPADALHRFDATGLRIDA